MATITGLTADRMLAIEGSCVVDGEIIADDLILTKHDGNVINAGHVVGPKGDTGIPGPLGYMPGQIMMWPGTVLPDVAKYGNWVWCNGGYYSKTTYPIAASHIAPAWDTAMGQAAPPAGNFRVPDMRGLVPAGMDAMPVGAARAGRVTRAAALTIATKTGEETHYINISEMPSHGHNIPQLTGYIPLSDGAMVFVAALGGNAWSGNIGYTNLPANTVATGGGTAHETMQPTVFISYIIKLDN